jgi:pyruvate/2-oxoglutarate dehydrogenase complex dihydrolipoamide dehydrogenase (E3) component
MTKSFDAIVIGAGQAGPSRTSRLTASGMKVALIERDKFGGTCVNTGCMPTKTLVASAYAAHLARRGGDYGIVLEQPVRVDMRKIRGRAATVVANASKGVESWLRNMEGCTVFQGLARFEGPNEVRVGEEFFRSAHFPQRWRASDRARSAGPK